MSWRYTQAWRHRGEEQSAQLHHTGDLAILDLDVSDDPRSSGGLRGTCKTWLNAATFINCAQNPITLTKFSSKFRQICQENSAKQQVFHSETQKSRKNPQHTEHQNNKEKNMKRKRNGEMVWYHTEVCVEMYGDLDHNQNKELIFVSGTRFDKIRVKDSEKGIIL